MSTADPYIQVPRRILDDDQILDVDGNVHHELLGWRVHLELLADAAWPAAAFLPDECPDWVLVRLRDGDVLVPFPAGRYRMPGYDAARETRTKKAAVGGTARAGQADRTPTGRFTSTATSKTNQQPLAATAGSNRTSDRTHRPGQPPYNRHPKENDVPRRDGVVTPPPGAPVREAAHRNGAALEQMRLEDEFPPSALET